MHSCEFSHAPFDAYGPAIEYCRESDGEFWVDNGEYATQVNYCPWCGEKAPKPVETPME